MIDTDSFPPATFVLYPAPDIPGQWIGHCPEVDVVTQGRSPEHALEMLKEAVAVTIHDDVARNADPNTRRCADFDIPSTRMTPAVVGRWIDRFGHGRKDE